MNHRQGDCLCVTGYVVQGSNGEYAYMRAEEKIDLVRKVRELAPKEKLILAGSGCEGEKNAEGRNNGLPSSYDLMSGASLIIKLY